MLNTLNRTPGQEFFVIHPLDDTPEMKVDVSSLGLMPRTPLVRWALHALRAYVGVIGLLIAYRVVELAAARLA